MVIQIVICQGQLAINLRDIRKYKGPQKLKEKKKEKKGKALKDYSDTEVASTENQHQRSHHLIVSFWTKCPAHS